MPRTLPHGTWPSPIDGHAVAASGARYGDMVATDDAVLFTKPDPDTSAMSLHRWTPGEGTTALADSLDVRSRVHEYGGGAIMAGHAMVVVVDFEEQRLWRVDGTTATALTPDTQSRVRFAAGQFVDADTLVVVRETHDDSTRAEGVVNELVVVDVGDGSQSVVVTGHDFIGDPAVGSDGRVAWVTWEHPHMPWDETTLWAGRIVGTGADATLTEIRTVAGGNGVSIADWAWQGTSLVHSQDSSGFWELTRSVPDAADDAPVDFTSAGLDLGHPRWQHGGHSLAVVGDTVVVIGVDTAHARLGVVEDGGWRPLTDRDRVVRDVAAHGDGVVTIEVDRDGTQALRRRDLQGDLVAEVDCIASLLSRDGDLGTVQAMTVDVGPASDDASPRARTHGFLHLPANADAIGPDGELPPLLLFVHGGPTSNVSPVAEAGIAYWTTRGFAVCDLNYRGSTGFGRDYRRLMRGRWGEIEVADAIAMATALADRGLVDRNRMAIRGGSAGGFTALAAVTQPSHPFACATSFFGVSDLAALAAHTHKFESRYLDSMVGRLPQDQAVYDQRSPVTNAANLSVPLLVLQGTQDRVVPTEQALAMVEAARANGVPHAYIEFAGEGHGFRKPDNVATWLESELAFYGEVMGFTPAGDVPRVLN